MIVTENMTINGKSFTRTYSDAGCYVMRGGVEYSEAIDPADHDREYAEGNRMSMTELEQKALAYDIITGVAE